MVELVESVELVELVELGKDLANRVRLPSAFTPAFDGCRINI